MNIHLLGLPLLKTHKQYLSQAQMQKIIAFPEIIFSLEKDTIVNKVKINKLNKIRFSFFI